LKFTNGVGSTQQHFDVTERSAWSDAGWAGESAKPVDEAELSIAVGVLAQALAGSDVRSDRISVLQQSIATGTYNVSSSKIASKLIKALLK
jgi:negative regulator of flagellin synthesis FlgM